MGKANKSHIVVLGIVLAFLWPACTQAAIVYEVIDLGTLGLPVSTAESINDAGQIVGKAAVRYGREWWEFHATSFDATGAGNNIDLSPSGSYESEAFCINNRGQIVGSVGYGHELGSAWNATLFDPTGAGNNIDLGTLGGFSTNTASSINDAGQIVGTAAGFGANAILFDATGAGDNIDLGTLGGLIGVASSINNAGQIVGCATNSQANVRATLFDPTGAGNNIDLGTLGGLSSGGHSINDAGQIVGRAENSTGDWRATLFDPTGAGNNIDLGTLGGDYSLANSINDAGQIVGMGHTHATLFDPTGAGNNIDLNSLIDPNSGWTLEVASDINNHSWIVGSGINPQGENHAFLLVPIDTKYSGGTGEPDNPYQIATAEDLMLLGETPEDYDKHFILTADIDLDPNLPGRKLFDRAVIAPQGSSFTGVFDGDGYVISNLRIEGGEYLGLFGRLDSGAIIQNLSLKTVDVNGTNRVGGLAGFNDGHIIASYSTGTVNGNGWAIGGLVGDNDGRITGSYNAGTVSGGDLVGGLVGTNWDRITMSYSTGTVSGDYGVGGLAGENFGSGDFGSYARITTSCSNCTVNGTSSYIGGLVGSNSAYITASYSNGAVSGPDQAVGGLVGRRPPSRSGMGGSGVTVTSFWDIETSGQTTSSAGTGLTTVEMQDINTYLNAGWDFVGEIQNGTCDYWQISTDGYPKLRFPVMPEGFGTAEQPYLIRDALDLGTVWFQPMAHYRLEASIDLSDATWSMPVVPRFDGTFDGNGFVISDLHIQGDRLVGLFGLLGDRGKISNLGLEAVDVKRGDYVGGLVGLNYGTIISSYSTGTIIGDEAIGGLVGGHSGTIIDCSSSTNVSSSEYGYRVGGLVGISYGNITASYSTSTVTADRSVGGLVGLNFGSINTSYSVGSVIGISSIGGLAGSNDGSITTSYSISIVSGETNIGGLVGVNWGSIATSYSAGSVRGDSDVGGLVGGGHSQVTGGLWDIETSGQITSTGGKGKTTSEMQMATTFEGAGWGCNIVWKINEGNDYPRLLWEEGPGEPITTQLSEFLEGEGTMESPYIVYTLQDIDIATSFLCEQDKRFHLGFLSGKGTQDNPYVIYSSEEIDLLTICPYEQDAYYELGFIAGKGTQDNPYLIYTAEQLDLLSICPYELDKHFILTADIDLDPKLPGRKVFDKAVISTLSGIFDGNGHTISNLTIRGEGIGLFGRLESGAELKDLWVVDVNVASSSYSVGGLVAYNEGDIFNCYCTGVVSGNSYVGGLVGKNHGNITASYSTGTFTGSDYVSGLVGWNKGHVTNCHSIGVVDGSEDVGGLVGLNIGSVISSYSTSRVSGSMYVGGLVGRNGGDVTSCYSTGAINGRVCIGGLVGNNWGVVTLCYSTGTVSGSGAIGGLVGQGNVGNVINCFWDIETCGWSTSSGGTGLITTEMQTASTFLEAGWDFVDETVNGTEDIWWIDEGQDYPRLWWELITEN